MKGSRQLTFDFLQSPAYGKSDFLVSDCNRKAYDWVNKWPDWPEPVLAVYGPECSGKSHLLHVWRTLSGAAFTDPLRVKEHCAPDILIDSVHCAFDNADLQCDDESFLHLFNYILEVGGNLLLVGRRPPSRWNCSLADLSSRLGSISVVEIQPPDDNLLGALLIKHFHDRQLKVSKDVLLYLLLRIERTFAAANAVVKTLDSLGLAEGRDVTVNLAREVLQNLEIEKRTNG